MGSQTEAHKWIQFSLFLVQRLPILILAVIILFSRRDTPDVIEAGPTVLSRVILGCAILLNLPNDIPLGYWFLFFKDTALATKCVLYLGNVFDIIVFLYLVSLVLWFCSSDSSISEIKREPCLQQCKRHRMFLMLDSISV